MQKWTELNGKANRVLNALEFNKLDLIQLTYQVSEASALLAFHPLSAYSPTALTVVVAETDPAQLAYLENSQAVDQPAAYHRAVLEMQSLWDDVGITSTSRLCPLST
jgi:hypothetical protein